MRPITRIVTSKRAGTSNKECKWPRKSSKAFDRDSVEGETKSSFLILTFLKFFKLN